MTYQFIKQSDPELNSLLEAEDARQAEDICLIPSENFVSKAVLEALGSTLTNKYAEGYPGKRYYAGTRVVDQIETLAIERAKALFGAEYVNVQPYSGSPANMAVYAALLQPGDTVLGLDLSGGGHLTHGSPVNFSGKIYNFVPYKIGSDGLIDYDEMARLAKEHQPKLIVSGATAYPRIIDFKRIQEIVESVGAKHLADISHIAGLVVGGEHPSPFPFTDVVTTTTHKSLRGPRGAIIISKAPLGATIDKAVFPGLQGGPHENVIAALAVCLHEAAQPDFKQYAQQIVLNAKALADELTKLGYNLVSGGTDNHLVLADLTNTGLTGKQAQAALEKEGIITNRNTIPNDPRPPYDPSGLRLGTPAMTTRGWTENDFRQIAQKIHQVLS